MYFEVLVKDRGVRVSLTGVAVLLVCRSHAAWSLRMLLGVGSEKGHEAKW